MFNNGITPEAIPERIYKFSKFVAENNLSKNELKDLFEPLCLNPNDRSYFKYVCDAAIELGLVKENNNIVVLNVDKKIVNDIDSFRMYCNSIIWKNTESLFYKITDAFLDSNDILLKYNTITSSNVISYIQHHTNSNIVDIKRIRGQRFWISFLGIGRIQEHNDNIYYLPNMYVALKDFIKLSNFKKNETYTFRKFMENICNIACIGFDLIKSDNRICFALSNALRTMHDSKEIELLKIPDSLETFSLFNVDIHNISNDVTHVLYKGVK